MGNQLCCSPENTCNYKENSIISYHFENTQNQTTNTIEEKPIVIPQLDDKIVQVLKLKNKYLMDFMENKSNIQKQVFGDDIYEGQLNNMGVPHGVGKMYKLDGSFFIGQFVEGKAHGQGLYILSDGSYFEGKLVNNQAQCQNGTYVSKVFNYVGNFKNNKFNGEGKQSSNNHLFIGTYQDGIKKFGQLKWWETPGIQHQFCYYGKFDEKGLFIDDGILKEPTGKYTGSFLNGKKHGEGQYLFKSNLKYCGQYKDGVKQGHGKVCYADGQMLIFEGGWKNGLPDGQGLKYDGKGKIITTFFKEGINILNLMDPQSI